jgi:hypothetical protein
LKEIGQVYINWKAKKRYLQTTIDATTTSPSSPHPTPCTNLEIKMLNYFPRIKGLIPQIFLPFTMEIPHYIGFGGLTTMEKITH